MMSPSRPSGKAARARRVGACASAVACAIALATAATPVTGAVAAPTSAEARVAERGASRTWSAFFPDLRPVTSIDARHVVVQFRDPSLGEWEAAGSRRFTPPQRRAWVKRALQLQQRRLDELAAAGAEFRIEHRYVRVLNGVSVVVHGDGAQLLRGVAGVERVTPVRTLWPTALDASGTAGAAAAAGAAAPAAEPAGEAVRVAVLDSAIDSTHPALEGRVAASWDATAADGSRRRAAPAPDEHGTAMAALLLRSADGTDVEVMPIPILRRQPAQDGVDALVGQSDDLLAGLEHAVDPDGNGDLSDRADVAAVASTSPYAGFAGSPEERAAGGADALGTVVVAAAGNDGASGDDVGTVGSLAAADAALAVGAADLRARVPAADVRLRGGGFDSTISRAPVLTASGTSTLPEGERPLMVIDAAGDDVVDYLDSELRSRVHGAVVLLSSREGMTIAAQVRAAADAGATAVLVEARDADAASGTIDVPGSDIPALGISGGDAAALRAALAESRLRVRLAAVDTENPAFGTIAGFSSAGPRLDGAARPDVLAPGVGMAIAAADGTTRTVSGTSVAAAWAAGQVAALRAARPDLDAATARAVLMGSAIPLGSTGDRPGVSLQGAGVVDAAAARRLAWFAEGGRVDFGAVAAGHDSRRRLSLQPVLAAAGAGTSAPPRILLDDGGRAQAASLTIDGDELVLDVAADAAVGVVGGWLVLPDLDLRIPWSATVRDPARAAVPLWADLTNRTLRRVARPGTFASTMTLAVGGSADGGSLGIEAIDRLELRLLDARGRDRGSVGGLDHALPGVYTFGIAGVGADGKRLRPGSWSLRVRYVPATDPDGAWRSGPLMQIRVAAPRAARR